MTEFSAEDENEESSEEDRLEELFGSMNVITITYDNNTHEVPKLDLGTCSPWMAITMLQTAIQTLELLIPPVDITYNGDQIVINDCEYLCSDEDEDC